MDYIFLQSIKSARTLRLRAIPGQKDSSGNDVVSKLNVAHDRKVSTGYPIGTVFVTNALYLNSAEGAPFYSASAIYPLFDDGNKYVSTQHVPSVNARNAWKQFCEDNGITDEQLRVNEAMSEEPPVVNSFMQRLRSESRFSRPTIQQDGFYVDEQSWYYLLRCILKKKNLMLIGASGTGKTELVRLACSKIGLACHIFDMGSMYDPMSQMLGTHRLEKGESVFDYAEFTRAVADENAVVLLDELSRAPVTTNNILLPCLDSRRSLPVEMASSGKARNIEVKCSFIATANIGADYTGTNALDRALVDRFLPLELDFMGSGDETAVLCQRTGCGKAEAQEIVKCASLIRKRYKEGELSSSVSTRHTLEIAELVADGETLHNAMSAIMLPLFDGSSVDSERTAVRSMILRG